MSYKQTDLIYILSTKLGYIPPLRQIGPIINPLKVTAYTAYKCVTIGTPVSQYDPETGLVIKLTAQNVYDDTKFTKLAEEIAAIKKGESTTSDTITDDPVEVENGETNPDTGGVVSDDAPQVQSVQTEYTKEQQEAYDAYIAEGYSADDAAELVEG